MALAAATRARTATLCALALLACATSAQASEQRTGTASAAPLRIAYVTAGARTASRVWVANAAGGEARMLGLGAEPQISPDGLQVAAALFGTGPGGEESGPALAVYPTSGAPALQLLDLSVASAVPLAWSPDSRYLAVQLYATSLQDVDESSGLAVLDTTTGQLSTIAHGFIYGASFAPDGSDRLIYARSASQTLTEPVNLYTAQPNGSEQRQLTSNGRSLYPLWGSHYIAYVHERLRYQDAPVYEIWLRQLSGLGARQLTHVHVSPLVSGLQPIAFSASGTRLLAEFGGEDTSEAWTVLIPSGRARRLPIRGHNAIAAGISPSGSTLLVDDGFLEGPASADEVATVPFAGGRPHVLVAHGSQASWNG